ncbi:unnamed protein product [Adineta steineri]|uniref:F-box domain-containing protein n=1 Tax=Adineta steineri TaxID=433720 RepID=A0A819G3L1_9BILA|nr:unnamed protein product [Adineta steineri]CAF3875282.1 unnamed protein product [Adineta steineri]
MDLPDEMIIKIWNNLNNIDVLYSFVGVNKRFDKLVRDLVYTRSIQLAEKDSKTNKYCPLPDLIIDRYCLNILPQIHQYIECLILEPISTERILLSTMYPRLHKLIFTKINTDFVLHHFTGPTCPAEFVEPVLQHFLPRVEPVLDPAIPAASVFLLIIV